jgi:hypothetical protein
VDDRARVPIGIASTLLDEARGKVKKEKFRLVTLEAPDEPDLAGAVTAGVADCVRLFTEKPPRGSANNFGTRSYDRWIKALRNPNGKGGWAKSFPPGRSFFAGLSSAFRYGLLFWEDTSRTADRALYADFLDESAQILSSESLPGIAEQFRSAGELWRGLATALLPDEIPILREARELLVERHESFLAAGNRELDRLHRIDARMEELRRAADSELTDERTVADVMNGVADQVERIRNAEQAAFEELAAVIR